ncbi:MAG: prepilin-type N-terminal cleavage/methylation domain-containing protein [Fibrobacter sp.]|nr:prepilin-type N-terminal cleavage/methylation domain-containing protein [Fibrobacter sp.]
MKTIKNTLTSANGFSLIEVIVALSISSLILIFLTRLFSVSLNSYNLQEQLADMNQNAKFTIKEISDILMQAGADLQILDSDPFDKDTIIIPDGSTTPCSGFTIKINPRGGVFQIPENKPAVCSIMVENAYAFRLADKLQKLPGPNSKPPIKIYSLTRYDSLTNFVVFNPADTFKEGDVIVSFVKNHYYLNGTDLCLDNDSNIIAENIDTMDITFLDVDGAPTSEWKTMRSVRITVCARTSIPDRKYSGHPDHYRRITLRHEFRLRNKVGSGAL